MSKLRFNHLFKEIIDWENMKWASRKAMKGKNRYNTDAIKFYQNEIYNLVLLRKSLIDGSYQFSGYKRFKVYEPKERIIDAPYHKDKIVQLAADKVLKRVYQPAFIFDSYACLDNKGTHMAVERVSYFMRKSAWEYGDGAYIIKLDIRRFFYSINRNILKGLLPRKIKCRQTLSLVNQVIDSAAEIDSKGLPLGNTLSQLLTNVYMNEFDRFCKRELKIKYYVRYADDVIAIMPDRQTAKDTLDAMIIYLQNALDLDVNEHKTKIFPIEQGVNAYGFKTYKTHRLLRDDSKKKIKRKARKMKRLIIEGRLSAAKAEQILNSWFGHAKYGSNFNFIQSLISRNDYIYLDQKGRLRIKPEIIKDGEQHAIP